MTAFCMKCRTKRRIADEKTIHRGLFRVAVGTCSRCGTKVSRILGAAKKN